MGLGIADSGLEKNFSSVLTSLLFPTPTPQSPIPTIAIALSGGADSMACALLADGYARAQGARIVALTVDHGLRPESRSEAEQVACWMHERTIEHHILTPTHALVSKNIQEAARIWRYNALADFCQNHGILHCLLGHHANDQHETITLHSERGETADGSAGMATLRNYRGVRFLRPLLGFEKAQLKHWLQAMGQIWVEDPTNHNPRFARARLRAQPSQPIHAAMAEGIARAKRDDALAAEAARMVTLHPSGYALIQYEAWRGLPDALAQQMLADTLVAVSGAIHRPRGHETARLAATLANAAKKRTLLGCEIIQHGNQIRIAREYGRVAAPVTVEGKGTLRWDDRFVLHYDLPANYPLTLRALGHDGKKTLRPLITGHWPLATPSLWHLEELVSLPHIIDHLPNWRNEARMTLGFAPAKPLAAAPFWWFKED